MSQEEVGEAMRPPTSKTQISRLETGERRLSLHWLNRIAPVYAVKPRDLLEPPPSRGGPPLGIETLAAESDDDRIEFEGRYYVAIPSYDVGAAAGPGMELPGAPAIKHRSLFRLEWVRRVTNSPLGSLAIITVEGDSMEPTLRNEDSVLVDCLQRRPDQREGIYVINNDGLSQIKRVQAHPVTKRLTIRSDNPAYDNFSDIDPSTIDIIGRVIWIGRQA